MHDREYSVKDTNGKYSPPISERDLFNYVRQGAIKPHTIVRDITGGRESRAADYPALAAIFRQNGVNMRQDAPPLRSAPIPAEPTYAPVQYRQPGNRPFGLMDGNSDTAGKIMVVSAGCVLVLLAVLVSPDIWWFNGAWFILCASAGMFAYRKGLSYFWGMGMSMWFSPIVGAIAVASQPVNQHSIDSRSIASGHFKMCPSCAELVKNEARRCRHCGTEPI